MLTEVLPEYQGFSPEDAAQLAIKRWLSILTIMKY